MMPPVLSREALSRVQHRRRRFVAVALVAVLAVSLFTGTAWGADGPIGRLIESTGLLLIAVAIVGRAWCSLYIGGRKAEELVTTGPYSLCRNPLYLFSFVGAFGVGLQSGSISLGLVFLAAAMAIFIPLIAREETYLSHAMPRTFLAYRARTPRLLPLVALWRSPQEIMVRPDLFVRTVLDGLPFVIAWPLFEGVELLQKIGLFPVLLRWP